MESSFSSSAISQMTMRSSQVEQSFSYFSHFCWSCFMRFCTFWLRSRSFQKPSFALSASSSAISRFASSSLSAAPSPSSVDVVQFYLIFLKFKHIFNRFPKN